MELKYDCLQRHQVAVVRLPSDGVDPSRLHGPVRVYRLGRPMDLMSLNEMPPELQRMYLERLRQQGGSPETAASMLGATAEELTSLLQRHHVVLDRPNPTAWSDFVSRRGEG